MKLIEMYYNIHEVNEMSKVQVVKSFNDANVLLEKGYRMIKIDRDRNNREYLIFIFEYSDELRKDLKELEKVHYK